MNIMGIINTTFYNQTYTNQVSDEDFEEINQYECMITLKNEAGKTFVINAHGNQFESNVIFNREDGDNQLSDEEYYELDANEIFDELKLENNFDFLSDFADVKL